MGNGPTCVITFQYPTQWSAEELTIHLNSAEAGEKGAYV